MAKSKARQERAEAGLVGSPSSQQQKTPGQKAAAHSRRSSTDFSDSEDDSEKVPPLTRQLSAFEKEILNRRNRLTVRQLCRVISVLDLAVTMHG